MRVDDAELTTLNGMVVTSPVRTVADVLCSMRVSRSIEVVTDGLRRGVLDVHTLQAAVRGARGRPGARRARFVVESCSDRPFSVLEWRFQRLVRGARRGWAFNTEVTDDAGPVGIVDALHAESRTVVELDGRRFHGEQRFQGDRTRDQRLAAAGYVVLRFTWDDIDRRPDHVREVVLRTIAVRSRSAPASTPHVGGNRGSR
jgi:very-short-patch-repair endonuclease